MRNKVKRKSYNRGTKKKKHRRPQTPAYDSVVDQVQKFLADNPTITFRIKDIIRELARSSNQERQIRDAVIQLVDEGVIARVKGKSVRFSDHKEDSLVGTLDLAEGGFGFVKVTGAKEDYFVPRSRVRGARQGDKVEIIITNAPGKGKVQAKILRILERNNTPVIGKFRSLPGRGGLVYPDNPRVKGPIEISEHHLQGAKDRDRVQVEIEDDRKGHRGKILRSFGPADDPSGRLKALITEHKFREKFSQKASEETEAAIEEISAEEIKAFRLDYRDHLVVTIDPESAHDFDDALSLLKLNDSTYELGVHIADVTWYVPKGSDLDKEARQRGTTVYTSHGTVPMLPERLSSDLCSLREGVERRSVSAIMTVNLEGEILDAKISRTVIKSKKRFTYEEVQKRIEEGKEKWQGKLPALRSNGINTLLMHLDHLTTKMRDKRFVDGGLNLNVPEYAIELDDNDVVTGIKVREVFQSNHLVEECMLAANRVVTEHAVRKRGNTPKAFIYRIHDKPSAEKLQDLVAFVQALGIEWTLGYSFETIKSRQVNDWLESFSGHPLADVIRIHTLRAMAKAEYNTENIGHYGLGFSNYTHFTSPIRRYPDIMVHRLLLDDIENNAKYSHDKVKNLQRDCELSSERERAAQDMERQSLKIRQAEYFERRIGEVFDGMIVSVIPKGVIVEIVGMGSQGLIESDELGVVYLDRSIGAFVEITGTEVFCPGKRMKVKIAHADPDMGRLELEMAD